MLRIMGIDPGFARTGIGVIEALPNKLKLISYDCLETTAKENFSDRLKYLHIELAKQIKKFQPNLIAVEELFFCKNVKTALNVGQARGVILLTAILANVSVVEYTPLQVKQAVSSYGRADKNQIQQLVKVFLNLKTIPEPDDAADALAVAICAANSYKLNDLYDKK